MSIYFWILEYGLKDYNNLWIKSYSSRKETNLPWQIDTRNKSNLSDQRRIRRRSFKNGGRSFQSSFRCDFNFNIVLKHAKKNFYWSFLYNAVGVNKLVIIFQGRLQLIILLSFPYWWKLEEGFLQSKEVRLQMPQNRKCHTTTFLLEERKTLAF